MAKIGVVLSGCGVFDGAEINESVLTLLALDKAGAEVVCYAPNVNQYHVINHLNGEAMDETRNVLVESARIARGAVLDLAGAKASDFDALIFPGGFGAAKNLSSFAFEGAQCSVNPEVERIIKEAYALKKPIGFACIAPALAAKILGNGVNVTIGSDPNTAKTLERMGAVHCECAIHEVCEDENSQIVTTPAYMLQGSIAEVAEGIEAMVQVVLAKLEPEQ